MADDLRPRAQRRGTLALFAGAAVVAVILGIAVLAWPLLTPTPEHSDAAGVRATQTEGTSSAGTRTAPPPGAGTGAAPESVGRAQSISGSAEPEVDLRPEQVEAIRDFAARQEPATEVDFSIVVGAAVPEKATLKDIPDDLVNVLPSYKGDRYLVCPAASSSSSGTPAASSPSCAPDARRARAARAPRVQPTGALLVGVPGVAGAGSPAE